jgi:excisionase family DNA binding protein
MTRQNANHQTLLTVADVANILNVDDTTIRRWAKQGLLEAVLLPHAGKRTGYRFKPETIDALLNSHAGSES